MSAGLFVWAAVTLVSAGRLADEVTWARDVAPILFKRCVACHQPDSVAPFSLRTYEEGRAHARQIARVVSQRLMPPWLPEEGDFAFANDRRLTADEIELFERWADAAAPSGALESAPPAPPIASGWQLGTPDLVVSAEQPYSLTGDGTDVFRNLVVPVPPAPDGASRYVNALEFRPGTAKVIHHAVMFVDPQRDGRKRDALDAENGFGGMDVGTAQSPDGHFLGWAPGRVTTPLPEGMAWKLDRGADLVLQLHLLPRGKPESVAPQIGLYFTEQAPTRVPMLLRLGPRELDIAPGVRDYALEDEFTLPIAVRVLSALPHAHFLGRSMRGSAHLPDGGTRMLLSIPSWDFLWQDEYRYAEAVELPAGTHLRMRFTYDNSADNPRNPHQPPRRVQYGPNSTDEMGELWLQLLPVDAAELPRLSEAFARKDALDHCRQFARAAREQPDDANAQYDYGTALVAANQFEAAERALSRALELDPNHISAMVNLGFLKVQQRDFAAARLRFEAALTLKPDHLNALRALARICEELGDYRAAARAWRKVCDREKDFAAARNYAWLLATAPDDEARDGVQALTWAQRVANAYPQDPTSFDTLAAALAEGGRFEDAIKAAQRALARARNRGDQALQEGIEARIKLYQARQPYRQPRR